MNNLIQHPITEALGWTMIHSLWQITLLVICYRGLIMLPHLRKAPIRYALGMGILGLSIVLSSITFYQVYEPPLVVELAQHSAEIAVPVKVLDDVETSLILSNRENEVSTLVEPSFQEKWKGFLSQLEPFIAPLALGWMLGILFMGMKFGGSWMYLRNLRKEGLTSVDTDWEKTFQQWVNRMGIKRPVQLRYSPRVSEPLTLGHLKPLVLIPLGLLSQQDPQQIEALLLHELAHIRRYDFAFNIVQSWVEILFFYHPAIWWISREVRESREHCCDDAAIAVSNNPLAYAQALTQLQLSSFQPSKTQLTMSASGNTSKFTQRIYRIMGQPTQNLASTKGNLVAILAFLGTFFLAFQQQQFQEEQAMLDTLMENEQVDTQTLQNWLLFTIHPDTDQEELDTWIAEIGKLSSHPFELKFKTGQGTIRELAAFKNENGQVRPGWKVKFAPEFKGLEKAMLVYDPILDKMYMHLTQDQNGILHFYDLATQAFGILGGESLPFGQVYEEDGSVLPLFSFQEQAIDQLPEDRFTIELTPQTTMDELLGWSIACSKLGMKLEYKEISFDSETGELVKLSGIYQNAVGKTMPFDYEHFDFVMFDVNRNSQTIPSALMAKIDSSESSSTPTNLGDQTHIASFKVNKASSDQDLQQIQRSLAALGVQFELDHTARNVNKQLSEIFGRFIYENKSYRLIQIDQLNEFAIQVYDREEDPVQLVLEEETFGSQILSPKPLKDVSEKGTTHIFTRRLNTKKGPDIFKEYGVSKMWYGSSEAIFQAEYEKFEQGLTSSTLLYLNNKQIDAEEFRQLALPVDSVKKFFYRDPIAAKLELGKNLFGPVYQVNTFSPIKENFLSKELRPISPKSPLDTPKAPIIVLDGKIISRPGPMEKLSPEAFKEQLGIDSEDIETINVIKGEAAINKYGPKGINGVIEIRTKDPSGLEGAEKTIEDIEPGSLPEIEKGEPNSQIKIKGSASKDSNQPLFVIDGIELDHYSIGDDGFLDIDLNPADIEHINVLKGEAAELKYGRKGENGVIEITTQLPDIIRLEISDFVLPNGNASATLKHSQKYNDILILRDWKESALSINGSLPEDRIDDLPFKKKQDYNALSQHHIHSIHSYKMNQRSGDKWVRFIYTDKAPEVLWRPSATGDYRDIDSKTQLFFLNMPKYRGQKMPLILVPYMAGPNRKNYYIQIHGADGEIMAQAYPDYSNWNLDSVEIGMRILNRKESIAEFGTSGVTGLLVVSFDQTEEKMDTSLDGKIESPQTHPELYPFKSAGTQFPVSGIGVAPNPAQEGEVDIRLILEKKQEVRVSIFDRLGKEVAFLLQKTFEKGGHTIPWSLDRLPAGYYLVVAQVDGKGMSTPLIIK